MVSPSSVSPSTILLLHIMYASSHYAPPAFFGYGSPVPMASGQLHDSTRFILPDASFPCTRIKPHSHTDRCTYSNAESVPA
jgi:hypothetical protein